MRHRSLAWRTGGALGTAMVVVWAGWFAVESAAAGPQNESRRPVLVELYTSEGCSSCPPADALLANLDSMQPIPGVQVIVLSEHVTYWDHEGWRDPYSLDEVTDRQKWYDDQFGLSEVYTPQAVVDGAVQVLGSDEQKLAQAISAAAAQPSEELAIDNPAWTGDGVIFVIHHGDLTSGKSKQQLIGFLAEDETVTPVRSGENAGKTLRNVAVVRTIKDLNPAEEGAVTLKLPGEDKRATGPIRVVLIAVDKHNGRVMGATERTVAR
ncbi:MAG TPA: DUF1223 domain-containing protein [Terracidiphilus sp.]|nr:DUF1223 domain-containing protein [Terracidiphilus sp.]